MTGMIAVHSQDFISGFSMCFFGIWTHPEILIFFLKSQIRKQTGLNYPVLSGKKGKVYYLLTNFVCGVTVRFGGCPADLPRLQIKSFLQL